MNATTGPDVSLLDPYRAEWTSLRAHRHNLLMEGPVTATHAALLLLKPHIGAPIVWKQQQGPFELPSREASVLILEDVETLTAEDQAELLARLDGARSHLQIISTTEHSLFPLVARGLFDSALYYRLNVVLLRFSERDRHATQRRQPHRSTAISTPPPL
jgi:Sigma-54 interaction domain